jgi:hypothetical protein
MNGRSEYLPRRNPDATSIRSILKFPEQIGARNKNAYDSPDVHMPFLRESYRTVDHLKIVENSVDFKPIMASIQTASHLSLDKMRECFSIEGSCMSRAA